MHEDPFTLCCYLLCDTASSIGVRCTCVTKYMPPDKKVLDCTHLKFIPHRPHGLSKQQPVSNCMLFGLKTKKKLHVCQPFSKEFERNFTRRLKSWSSALCMHPCTASGKQVLTCVLWLGDRNAYSFPFPIWWKPLAFPALFRKTGTTRGLRWDSHLRFSIGQGFMNCLHKGVIL